MKLELAIFVDEGGEVHVFPRPSSPVAVFELTWELWERPELAGEISDAVATELEALRAEADSTMSTFFRDAPRKLAEEERRLDEAARREEWSA